MGGGAALRAARAEPAGREGALRAARRRARDRRSTSTELAEASEEYVEQVSQAVATDADTAGYVEELERRADSLDWLEESDDLASGDALAAEITRFLREREADGDAPESGGPG